MIETGIAIVLEYREQVIKEMKLLGATDKDIFQLTAAMLVNAIKQKRNPKDVAWAILQ